MVDEDYDGSNFVVKQVFFCGGDKSEFDKWKKGLDNLAKDSTKKKVEKTLKIEIDDEAFDRLYGHISHPIEIKKKGQKIAVRIISQFGEECTKVLTKSILSLVKHFIEKKFLKFFQKLNYLVLHS
jgi:adenine-specific DNA-methyltransferase